MKICMKSQLLQMCNFQDFKIGVQCLMTLRRKGDGCTRITPKSILPYKPGEDARYETL